MSTTTSKVLTGCGIGCLLVIVLGVGLGFMGYRWAQDAAEMVEEAGRIQNELGERFGEVRDFHPAAEPGIPGDRLEAFLAIREALSEQRNSLTEAIEGLAPGEDQSGVVTGFRAAKAGISIAPGVIEFSNSRNRALLDHEMGLGEYTWIYWYTFNAWLGHPADDSLLHEIMTERSHNGGRVDIRMDGGLEPERLMWRLRRNITAMLRHLVEVVGEETQPTDLQIHVAAEVAALEADPARIPWQDGLPEGFKFGLEPYRERLQATYSRATNPFELIEFD